MQDNTTVSSPRGTQEVATSISDWVGRIRPHLEAAAENIIAAGRHLVDANASLDHGDFLHLVNSLELRPRTAQKFMAIARNQLMANASPGTHLPTSWTTLYELTRAPGELLEEALVGGEVTPDMTRKEALQLVARLRGQYDEESARSLSTRLREAQWEMGGVAAGCLQAGMDITCATEMVGDIPPVWETFGYDGPVDWLEDCVVLFVRFPKPDFSRPWDEQETST